MSSERTFHGRNARTDDVIVVQAEDGFGLSEQVRLGGLIDGTGPTGPAGPAGAKGDTGAAGATGPAGVASLTALEALLATAPTSSAGLAVGQIYVDTGVVKVVPA